MTRLKEQTREEDTCLEEGKDKLRGLQLISIQQSEDDDPTGLWLLREMPMAL